MSPQFIRDILASPRYKNAIPNHKLEVDSVDVASYSEIRLDRLSLPGLSFKDVTLPMVTMADSVINGSLELDNVRVKSLYMEGLTVDNVRIVLTMFTGAGRMMPVYNGVLDATGSKINGNLHVFGVVACKVSLQDARVAGSAYVDGLSAYLLDFRNGQFSSAVTLTGSHLGVQGKASCDDTEVTDALKLANVNFEGAHFASTLKLINDEFSDADSARRHDLGGYVGLGSALIGGSLEITGSTFYSVLDLGGSEIANQLILAREGTKGRSGAAVRWGPDATLFLDNAKIGTFYGPRVKALWPKQIEIRNLSFKAFVSKEGALWSDPGESLPGELPPVEWYPYWLSLAPARPFSPQPYEAVRAYLTASGELDAATAVGIKEKDQLRNQQCANHKVVDCVLLWMSWATIGYGYRLWLSVGWTIFFVIAGAMVFRKTEAAYQNSMPYGLAYSFETFIPFIKLRERHSKIEASGKARYYFYIHKLAGWIIGLFLVAAVSGLTK